MSFIVLGIWNLRHVFTRDPWFWWIHGWMNMKEKSERIRSGARAEESERAIAYAESSGMQTQSEWSGHTFEKALWLFTHIFLLPISYRFVWNFLVITLFGWSNEKRQPWPAHKWWAQVSFEIIAVLTKLCSDYKLLLLLLLLSLHVHFMLTLYTCVYVCVSFC